MLRQTLTRALLSLLFLLTFSSTAATEETLRLRFSDDAVYIGGVRRNSSVAIFAASWSDITPAPSLSVDRTILRDDDHDEMVVYAPPGGIPPASMIVAVDIHSGRYGFGRPGSAGVSLVAVARLNQTTGNRFDLTIGRARSAHILLVRPQDGFWHSVAHDGFALDTDATVDRTIRVSFADLESVDGRSRGPGDPRPRDLVFVLDPYKFALQVLVVER